MQDPAGVSEQVYRRTKPQKKQLAVRQPKASIQIGSSSENVKTTAFKSSKTGKKVQKATRKAGSSDMRDDFLLEETSVRKPVVSMTVAVTDGESRALYKAMKHKYLLLEEESFVLVDELEKTEAEVKQLQEEKSALLDELLVLEGLAFNPYPPFEPACKSSEVLPTLSST
eukprot:c23463_g1_i1 orf=378-887(-)